MRPEREAEIRETYESNVRFAEDFRSQMPSESVSIGELLAELDRLRAIVAAGVDREQAYALVERELRECGLVELHRGDAVRNRPGTVYARDARWMYEGEYRGPGRPTSFVSTLIEAVNALKVQAGGEHD